MDALRTKRLYNFTDAHLVLCAGTIAAFAQRDADELRSCGINAAQLQEFISLKNLVADFPTDSMMLGTIIECTRHKDLLRAELIACVQGIYTRTQMCFGKNSPQVYCMDVYNLSARSDVELFASARRVHVVATENAAALALYGVREEGLGELSLCTAQFEFALLRKRDAESDRIQKTRERIELGNRLYTQVLFFCEAGKLVFKQNSAKYRDYVLYPNETPAPPDIPTAPRYEQGAILWDAVEDANSYQLLRRASNQSVGQVVYVGKNRHYEFSPPHPPPKDVVAYYFSVLARNAGGYSQPSNELAVFV